MWDPVRSSFSSGNPPTCSKAAINNSDVCFFNHNPMSSEDQVLHVSSHFFFFVSCHPCTYSACCSVTVLSLTERMLNSEPELAWDGRMNKSISRCVLCFHFIKYKHHGGQKPPWAPAVGVRRLPQGLIQDQPSQDGRSRPKH